MWDHLVNFRHNKGSQMKWKVGGFINRERKKERKKCQTGLGWTLPSGPWASAHHVRLYVTTQGRTSLPISRQHHFYITCVSCVWDAQLCMASREFLILKWQALPPLFTSSSLFQISFFKLFIYFLIRMQGVHGVQQPTTTLTVRGEEYLLMQLIFIRNDHTPINRSNL